MDMMIFLLFTTGCNTSIKSIKKNNLHSITVIKYDAIVEDGEIVKGQIKTESYFLRNRSNVIAEYKIIHYDHRGKDGFGQFYKYDQSNQLIESFKYGSGRPIQIRYAYKYDSKDRMVEKMTWFRNKEVKNIMKYDANDNILERRKYVSDELSHRTTYEYNDKNDKIRIQHFHETDTLRSSIYEPYRCNEENVSYMMDTFMYDTKGLLIEEKNYTCYHTLSSRTTYRYDEEGREIGYTDYDDKGLITASESFFYDERDNWIQKVSYFYDEGETSEIKVEYIYKYKKDGSWIEKITIQNDKPVSIIERHFEYY